MIIIQFMVILTNLIAACIHSLKKKKQHDLIHFNKKKKSSRTDSIVWKKTLI